MFKVIIILIFFSFYIPANSSPKDKIISQMELTNNLSFNFKQTIDDKNEKGSCVIKYPKKIYCEYTNIEKKIIVSNGKFLVIKNRNNGSYYIYPLKKTPLDLLLNKRYLISKISKLDVRNVDNKYFNFRIFENNNTINLFFDMKTFNLIGWQTEDIYQNLNITFMSQIEINQKINDNIFTLPKNDY